MASSSRRLRAFKRWMSSQGIEWSGALEFTDCPENGISVIALFDLKEGDVVAKIPKSACLTIKTSGAREIIKSAGLGGSLGLSVAVMYERSLGEESPWAGYLQLLPQQECLPLVWTLDEVDSLLRGTELHKTVKVDKTLIYEDWKESIQPLLDSSPLKLNPNFFGVEEYFAAKSLIASRSFEIDEYHGFRMVPLADLFNHKTGAEDVHFTALSSHDESDGDGDSSNDNSDAYANTGDDDEQVSHESDQDEQAAATTGENSNIGSDSEHSSSLRDDSLVLEIIMVKDVKSGAEVFNTYGSKGNAALLHRYGFTEPDNPYDIVNMDLELVLKWGSSLFSDRHCRSRLSLWRRLDYSGCESQDSEYFEISSDGEPQIELLLLLYIVLLPEDTYLKLDLHISTAGNKNGCIGMILLEKLNITWDDTSEMSKNLLLTESVCSALLELADMRDSLYGSGSIADDIEALKRCRPIERKLYHSLMLRVSERKILEKLRRHASAGASRSSQTAKKTYARKKLKKGK